MSHADPTQTTHPPWSGPDSISYAVWARMTCFCIAPDAATFPICRRTSVIFDRHMLFLRSLIEWPGERRKGAAARFGVDLRIFLYATRSPIRTPRNATDASHFRLSSTQDLGDEAASVTPGSTSAAVGCAQVPARQQKLSMALPMLKTGVVRSEAPQNLLTTTPILSSRPRLIEVQAMTRHELPLLLTDSMVTGERPRSPVCDVGLLSGLASLDATELVRGPSSRTITCSAELMSAIDAYEVARRNISTSAPEDPLIKRSNSILRSVLLLKASALPLAAKQSPIDLEPVSLHEKSLDISSVTATPQAHTQTSLSETQTEVQSPPPATSQWHLSHSRSPTWGDRQTAMRQKSRFAIHGIEPLGLTNVYDQLPGFVVKKALSIAFLVTPIISKIMAVRQIAKSQTPSSSRILSLQPLEFPSYERHDGPRNEDASGLALKSSPPVRTSKTSSTWSTDTPIEPLLGASVIIASWKPELPVLKASRINVWIPSSNNNAHSATPLAASELLPHQTLPTFPAHGEFSCAFCCHTGYITSGPFCFSRPAMVKAQIC